MLSQTNGLRHNDWANVIKMKILMTRQSDFQRQKQVFIGHPSILTAYITLQRKKKKENLKHQLPTRIHTPDRHAETCTLSPRWMNFGPYNRVIEKRQRWINDIAAHNMYKTYSAWNVAEKNGNGVGKRNAGTPYNAAFFILSVQYEAWQQHFPRECSHKRRLVSACAEEGLRKHATPNSSYRLHHAHTHRNCSTAGCTRTSMAICSSQMYNMSNTQCLNRRQRRHHRFSIEPCHQSHEHQVGSQFSVWAQQMQCKRNKKKNKICALSVLESITSCTSKGKRTHAPQK